MSHLRPFFIPFNVDFPSPFSFYPQIFKNSYTALFTVYDVDKE